MTKPKFVVSHPVKHGFTIIQQRPISRARVAEIKSLMESYGRKVERPHRSS